MKILLQCTDEVGLVAKIAGVMAAKKLNILSMREFVNRNENRFYLRLELNKHADPTEMENALKSILPTDAQIQVGAKEKKKIAVLVTKEFHCLGDILLRNFFDTLDANLQVVIGNHETLRPLCERFQIPFHYVSHENGSKEEFENELIDILENEEFDYIVLAKFMRILSPSFVEKYKSKIINIHHSFLPAFIGASPYKQAHERGVKMIGATAHFVTNDLDEGPIISQQIIPVNHAHSVKDMVEAGKEIERSVLVKALQLVLNDRVIVSGNKTIVFE